jgi:Phage gp6-like head-tail connector protein
MTVNANDMTTIANVKSWLGIKSNDSDDDLARLITACSFAMQAWMNRDIIVTNYTERRDGNSNTYMVVSDGPIVAMISVTIDNVSVPLSTGYGIAGYQTDNNTIYLTNYKFTRGHGNVQLVYSGGFTTVPYPLEQACIETIAMRWRERERIGLASKGLAGETTAFSLKDFPAQVLTIMSNYKKVISL